MLTVPRFFACYLLFVIRSVRLENVKQFDYEVYCSLFIIVDEILTRFRVLECK